MLEAGHYLVSRNGRIQVSQWYDLPGSIDTAATNMSLDAIRKEVRDRLSRAVEKRLVSDVPFGAFLSGGIDSSAVVGLMAQASSGPVHTFSVVFDEEEFSEERYARIIAKKFNTEHTAIRLRPENMLALLPDALRSMDHPSADGPNTYVVSKVTKQAGITMALSGLGGDEVFAGYPVFTRSLALHRKKWITTLPVSMRKAGAALVRTLKRDITGDKLAELMALPSFDVADTYPVSRLTYSDVELDRLFGIHHPPPDRVRAIMSAMVHGRSGIHLLSQVSLGELSTYLQNVLLRDTDQMSMAHALEVRVPFLDHELVQFVLGVPDVHKYPHTPKKLLIDSLGDLLPPEVVHRPKMGFTLPWEHWMRNELKDLCTSRLSTLDARGLIGAGTAMGLWKKFILRDPRVNWSRVWSLVVLGDWLERHDLE
jgi:asparagine synthase (glutamine-hydrolysing)